jgi:hypothetical protein
MAEVFCDKSDVQTKSGANVSSAITDAIYTEMIERAQAFITNTVKIEGINLVSDYTNMQADVKLILNDCCSSKAALEAINYDMSGYTSREEAQTMLDVNYAIFTDALNQLKKKPVTDYLRSFNT